MRASQPMRSNRMRGGIRSWVSGALVLACGVPLVAVYFFTTVVTRREMQEESAAMLEKMCDQVAEHISEIIENTEHDLQALAALASAEDPDAEKLERELEMFKKLNQMIVSIELLDKEGFLYASSARTTGQFRDMTTWFKTAVAGEWAVSRPKRESKDGELYVSVYAPAERGHGIAKVVKISVSLAPIRNVIERTEVLNGGDVVLVDGDGLVLERRGGRRSFEPASARISGALAGLEDDEFTNVVAVVPGLEGTPIYGWKLVWSERTSEFVKPGERAVQMVLGAFGLATVVALLAGILVTRAIARPLIRLSDLSLSAAAGELDGQVPMEGPMEVRELGWAFNRMLVEVRKSRAVLEAEVDARTRSLEESREQERKLAKQLSASFEAAPEGVLVLDCEGSVLKANGRIGLFFGVDLVESDGEGTGDFVERMMACFTDRDGFEQVWGNLEQSGGEEWETVCGGVRRTLRVCASPVADGDGEIFARLWMFHDVTEQRLLQRGLQQAQKMEAVGQLAGGIAHDFNNLLTGIDGNLALIEMDRENAFSVEGREAMAMARQSCERAARLVRGLLGYSRQSCLEKGRICPNLLVTDTVKLLRVMVDPAVKIVTELDPTVGHVHIDVAQVQQIVINLSLNARDSMPEGGTLTIRTRSEIVDKSEGTGTGALRTLGSYAVIEVEDEGDGIGEEIHGRIFEPFFTTKETGKGTGLGLAMSLGIAQQHGGWIECDSEVEKGAKFCVYLPELMRGEPVSGDGTVTGAGRSSEPKALRVLVADDEFVVRVVAEGMLRKMGHEVTGVSNGREAVEACRRDGKGFDLVVLDMTMPEMSGKQALGIIKQESPDMPVVICSGFSLDFASFGEKGGPKPDLIMQKPYSPDQLERAIMDATESRAEVAVD